MNAKQLEFSLSQLGEDQGAVFEEFANKFLASEFQNLRPSGGMHDGGADGLLYETDSSPTTFIQSSVTKDPVDKIRRTVERLKKFGRDCRELIYCSPYEIQITTEKVKKELREKGVALDVRDRKYFSAFCDIDVNRQKTSAELFSQIGAPFLVSEKLMSAQEVQLTTNEEKLAVVYLTVAVSNSDPNKSTINVSYESLITYVLRDTNHSKVLAKEEVLQKCREMVPAESGAIFLARAEGALTTLTNRGISKYRTDLKGYHLAHQERERIDQSIMALELEVQASLEELKELTANLEKQLKLTTPLPVDTSAQVVLATLNQVLSEQGITATTALTKKVFCEPTRDSLRDVVADHLHLLGVELEKRDREALLDFYAILVEIIVRQPPKAIAEYLRKVADAYFLFFTLKQPPEVQDAVSKIVSKSRIVVDASVIVPALAEYAFKDTRRLNQNVLKAATASGAELFVTDLALNEIVTQLGKARAIYERIVTRQPHFGQSALVTAYFDAKGEQFTNFYEFLALFTDSENPQDIAQLLISEFGIQIATVELGDEENAQFPGLFESWLALKTRRTSVDEHNFNILAEHDVKTLLMIKRFRRMENISATQYGHSWWWLTHDSTAHSIDRSMTKPTEVSACMRPDYLLRYVSISPGIHKGSNTWAWNVLPISIDLVGCGLVPEEIIAASASAAGIIENDPEFLRQRKLRNLINRSRLVD